MPNIKSAAKRLRQSIKRRAANRTYKSAMRTLLRKQREVIAAGDVAASKTMFVEVSKRLDQLAAKRVIHRNKAARLKSRYSARLKQMSAPPAAPAAE